MKPLAIFTVLTALMLGFVVLCESTAARVSGIYVAFGFAVCALAYAFRRPGFWRKKPDGRIGPWSYILWGPLHALNWVSLLLAIWLERAKPLHEVAPNIWLGRRLLAREVAGFPVLRSAAVLDLTSEFAENNLLRQCPYLCLPTLDHTAPTSGQVRQALGFMDEKLSVGPVFIHCAMGHGRSATIVAAWLLQHGKCISVESAEFEIQKTRKRVRMKAEQMRLLRVMFPSASRL